MEPVIIFDNGTYDLKAGLSNQEEPSVIIPNIVGRPLILSNKVENVELKPLMISEEVENIRSYLNLSCPMKNNHIIDENDIEIIWDYALTKKLGFNHGDLKDRRMLIVEKCYDYDNTKKIGEIIFEKFGLGFFNVEPQPRMVLFAYGRETGTVLDIGEESTNITPVCETYPIFSKTKRLDIGGRFITDYFIRLLQRKGYALSPLVDSDFVQCKALKEKYCFVSCDFESDVSLNFDTTYYNSNVKLPDGRKIIISNEKFEAPEILFKPEIVPEFGSINKSCGIHELLYESINVIRYYIIL